MGALTERTVKIGAAAIRYTLERKAVKNINLRVRPDGSVYVSAPRLAGLRLIDGFVREKAAFILRAHEQQAARREHEAAKQAANYADGDTVYLLGRAVPLELVSADRSSVAYDGRVIRLQLDDIEDTVAKERLLQLLFDKLCRSVFQEALLAAYELAGPYGAPLPTLHMRTMKTRWGSCNAQKRIINMNKLLIHMPKECIEQVMVHEFCHFFEQNHSARFYAWLTRLQPDWQQRKRLLEAWAKRVL